MTLICRKITISISVVTVAKNAFSSCTTLTDVYYGGTAEEWEEIDINSRGNTALINAIKHFAEVETFTVTFVDYNGTVLKTETVHKGEAATAPDVPERTGYNFDGWDITFNNVTSNLTLTAVYSLNVTEPTIIISSAEAFKGDSNVEITVALKNNSGIASLNLLLSYDEGFTLTNIAYNSEIGGMAQQPANYNSPVILNWINGTANSNGDFLFTTLTFVVSDDAIPSETAKLSLTYDEKDIYDISETNIEFYAPDYNALIIDYTPEDINSDGVVNNKDVTRLFQYLSDWDVDVNEAALDVKGNGSVNNKDLTRLFQYTSGWEVELY